MTDFYAIPTNIGEAKIANALALGQALQITQLAVGDGTGSGAQGTPLPNPSQTALVSEQRRAALNTLSTDQADPNVLIAEQVIPEDVGGWWIREMGLIDADGDLIAVCNTPPTYKPILQSGSGRTQVVRMQIIVSDSAAVTLKVDPAVVLATRQYADTAIETAARKRPGKHPVKVAATSNVSTNGEQTIDGVSVVAGDRVLLPHQSDAAKNGIWIVAEGAWTRAPDADASTELYAGVTVRVQRGTLYAATEWVLTTTGAITPGTTAQTWKQSTDTMRIIDRTTSVPYRIVVVDGMLMTEEV